MRVALPSLLLTSLLMAGCSTRPTEDLCVGISSREPSNGDLIVLTMDGVTQVLDESDDDTCFATYALGDTTSIRAFRNDAVSVLLQFPGAAAANSTFDLGRRDATLDVADSTTSPITTWKAVAGTITVLSTGGEGAVVEGRLSGVVLELEADHTRTRTASGSFRVTHVGVP